MANQCRAHDRANYQWMRIDGEIVGQILTYYLSSMCMRIQHTPRQRIIFFGIFLKYKNKFVMNFFDFFWVNIYIYFFIWLPNETLKYKKQRNILYISFVHKWVIICLSHYLFLYFPHFLFHWCYSLTHNTLKVTNGPTND